jgi:hypothetical protein
MTGFGAGGGLLVLLLSAVAFAQAPQTAEEAFDLVCNKLKMPDTPFSASYKTTVILSPVTLDDQTFRDFVAWRRQRLQDEMARPIEDDDGSIAEHYRQRDEQLENDTRKSLAGHESSSWRKTITDGQRWKLEMGRDGPIGAVSGESPATRTETKILDNDVTWTIWTQADGSCNTAVCHTEDYAHARDGFSQRAFFESINYVTYLQPVELRWSSDSDGASCCELVLKRQDDEKNGAVLTLDSDMDFAVTGVATIYHGEETCTWAASNWQKHGNEWIPGTVETRAHYVPGDLSYFACETGRNDLPDGDYYCRTDLFSYEIDPEIPEGTFALRIPKGASIKDSRDTRELFGLLFGLSCYFVWYETDAEVVGWDALNKLSLDQCLKNLDIFEETWKTDILEGLEDDLPEMKAVTLAAKPATAQQAAPSESAAESDSSPKRYLAIAVICAAAAVFVVIVVVGRLRRTRR